MRVTPFLCSMSHVNADIAKAIEALAFQLDAKQWALAGVELGRIQELAARLTATCRLAQEPLDDESRSWDETPKEPG